MGKFVNFLVGATILKNAADNRKQKNLSKQYEKQYKENIKLSRKKAFLFEKDGVWHIIHTDEMGQNHITSDKSETDVKDTFFAKHHFDPKTFITPPEKYLRDFKLKTWGRNAPVTYAPKSSTGETILGLIILVFILYQCAKEDEKHKLETQKNPTTQVKPQDKETINKPAVLENIEPENPQENY